jgi:hypothetical protein
MRLRRLPGIKVGTRLGRRPRRRGADLLALAVHTPVAFGGVSTGSAFGHRSAEELLERPLGAFRRRTRVIALPNDRLGIRVRVDVDGRRPRAGGGIVIASDGALAPEWSRGGEPPRGNPFACGPRATPAGLLLCALLLLAFFLLV